MPSDKMGVKSSCCAFSSCRQTTSALLGGGPGQHIFAPCAERDTIEVQGDEAYIALESWPWAFAAAVAIWRETMDFVRISSESALGRCRVLRLWSPPKTKAGRVVAPFLQRRPVQRCRQPALARLAEFYRPKPPKPAASSSTRCSAWPPQGHPACQAAIAMALPSAVATSRLSQPQGKPATTARAATWIGAPPQGRVPIVDDVIRPATSVRESEWNPDPGCRR